MSSFHFKPSARLQRYLGQELIADPNLAVLEFVKNAYDAGAENVFIQFSFPPDAPSLLIIADDGDGMDEASFERNWMHPGYSEKSSDAVRTRRRARQHSTSTRTPVGEKGLGRLAAGRLGNSLEVFTRRNARQSWLHVEFEWSKFDDMSKLIDEVAIDYDHATVPEDPPTASGTILVIRDLQQNWDGRVRGRPVPGRSRTRLGRLKQDLQLLVRPLGPTDTAFTIHLDSDSFLNPDDIGIITPEAAVDESDYAYTFEFRVPATGQTSIRRELRRSDDLISEFGGKKRQRFPAVALHDVAAAEHRPDTLDCGPFKGQFLYSPPPAAKRAREIDAVGFGVLLYRDAVLVEPYGLDGNDWVGVSARKAQRQGYALIQPSLFSGYVLITREENPGLRDMSNRQGLLEGEVSETFIRHVQAEFSFFESHVFEELKKRWESKEEKAARQAEDTIDLASVRLRAIAHSLGQPLLGLDADITAIRIVAKKRGIPAPISKQLVELADSATTHLRQAQDSLSRFRDVPSTERSLVLVGDLVTASLKPVRALAKSLGVTFRIDHMPKLEVLVHRELVIEAIAELARNAVEAQRPAGAKVEVLVGYHDHAGDFVLDIRDDGQGIEGFGAGGDLSSVASTKGRPGMGLTTVFEIVTASRGRVRIAQTGPTGTHVEVSLPDRLRGLRS